MKSSAEVLRNEAKAAGIDRTFETNPGSAEFDVNRAGVRPDESVCFDGDLRDAYRHELRRRRLGVEHAVAEELAPETPGRSDSSAI